MNKKEELEQKQWQVVEKWMNTEDPIIANELEKEYDRLTKKLHNL